MSESSSSSHTSPSWFKALKGLQASEWMQGYKMGHKDEKTEGVTIQNESHSLNEKLRDIPDAKNCSACVEYRSVQEPSNTSLLRCLHVLKHNTPYESHWIWQPFQLASNDYNRWHKNGQIDQVKLDVVVSLFFTWLYVFGISKLIDTNNAQLLLDHYSRLYLSLVREHTGHLPCAKSILYGMVVATPALVPLRVFRSLISHHSQRHGTPVLYSLA